MTLPVRFVLSFALATAVSSPMWAASTRTITVEAGDRDREGALVTVLVTPPAGMNGATAAYRGQTVATQCARRGDKLAVSWMLPSMKADETRVYTMTFSRTQTGPVTSEVRRSGNDLDLYIKGELFARYDVTTGPNKPYFHPVYAPGQRRIVRGWPVAPAAGDTTDHRHHRGLWFTHGSVNGADFWAETANKTVPTGVSTIESGPLYASFTATTDWITADGVRIATDRRLITAYEYRGMRIMDLAIDVEPVSGPLVFGDTKEGSFGLRLADSMRLRGGDGHILNSEGQIDGSTWGKRASWVDYRGSVDGATVGIAIFDSPTGFRHPTYWHVRDYGLFCANPFGVHDFEQGRPEGAGDHTVAMGDRLKLRYRLVVYRGMLSAEYLGQLWSAYADPPHITVR